MSVLAGFLISLIALVLLALRGGSPAMLVDPVAMLLIVAGTAGAFLIICSFSSLKGTFAVFKSVLWPVEKGNELVGQIIDLAAIVRWEGFLGLEGREEEIREPILKKGLTLLMDTVDPDTLRSILEKDVLCLQEEERSVQEIVEQLAVFAPGIGMVGTLVQIVMMLGHARAGTPLAPQIAHALLPLAYGAFVSYLLLFPLAARIRANIGKRRAMRELCIEGVMSIQAGEPPKLVEDRLERLARS